MGVYYYLKSLNLKPGSEIILTPITIPDLLNVIIILKLKPVFVEMDLETHSMSLKSLEASITKNSSCIIITHLSGIVMNGSAVKKLCESKGLLIIEDISQAYGTKDNMGEDPFFGNVLIGSLSSGKTISTYTGGFILCGKNEIIEKIIYLKNSDKAPPRMRFLREILANLKINLVTSKLFFPIVYMFLSVAWKYYPGIIQSLTKTKFYTRSIGSDIFFDDYPVLRERIPSGWKTRLSSWQATVGLRFLKKIDTKKIKRQAFMKLLLENLSEDAKNRIPVFARENLNYNGYHLPFYIPGNREDTLKRFFYQGIDAEGYGLNLCNKEPIFKDISSHAREIADEVKYNFLFLPLHESYNNSCAIRVAALINKHIKDDNE